MLPELPFLGLGEIDEHQPDKSKAYLFRACYIKGVSQPWSLVLKETEGQAEGWEGFIYSRKKGRIPMCLLCRLSAWVSCKGRYLEARHPV